MPHTATQGLTQEMRACIDECIACYAICVETQAHCIGMGGRHAEAQHLNTLADCAKLCEVSANAMLRMSDFHAQICRVCAEACDRCARSCEQVDRNDETMRQCAERCRSCADSCRLMAA